MKTKLQTQFSRMLSVFTTASLLVTLLSLFPTRAASAAGIVGTITRPGFLPTALALDVSRNRLFVFDQSTHSVFVYNATTFQELGSVATSLSESYSMAVVESQGKLYVGYSGPGVTVTEGIAVIEIPTITLLKYLPSGGYVNLTHDEQLDVVYASSSGSVTQINVATDAQTTIAGIWGNLIDSAVKAVKGNVADKKGMVAALRKANFNSVRDKFTFGHNHIPVQNFYLLKAVAGPTPGSDPVMEIQKTVFTAHKDAYGSACKMKW